jgi:hypothetical protein
MKRMGIWEFMMLRQIRYAVFEFPLTFILSPRGEEYDLVIKS